MEIQTEPQKNPTQVERLRQEAIKNPALSAVMLVFTLRQRARQQVTMARLKVVMAQEGYKFTKSQLEDVLRFLASVNIGTLERSSRGRIRALKNIKVTLQSLGQAALTKADRLENYNVPSRFIKLPMPIGEKPSETFATSTLRTPISTPPTPPEKISKRQYSASLVVTVDGNDIEFELPKKVTMEEFFKILGGMYEHS